MERLTCVGGPVVYRTGIICPPPIARLNYSSRDEPGQTLHCFNRSPIIRQLLELRPTARIPNTEQSGLWVGATRCTRIKPLSIHPLLANYASTFHSYDCRRSDNCRKGERALADALMVERKREREIVVRGFYRTLSIICSRWNIMEISRLRHFAHTCVSYVLLLHMYLHIGNIIIIILRS